MFWLLASYWVYNPFLKLYSFLMKFFEWNLCLKFYFSYEFSWWCYFSFLKWWKIHLILVLASRQDYRSFLSVLYLNFSWPSSWHSWWLSDWDCAKMKWNILFPLLHDPLNRWSIWILYSSICSTLWDLSFFNYCTSFMSDCKTKTHILPSQLFSWICCLYQ